MKKNIIKKIKYGRNKPKLYIIKKCFYKNINYLYLIIIKKANYLLNIDLCVFYKFFLALLLKFFSKHKKVYNNK